MRPLKIHHRRYIHFPLLDMTNIHNPQLSYFKSSITTFKTRDLMAPTAVSNGGLPLIKSPSGGISPRKSVTETKASNQNQIHSYHKLFWRLNVTLEFNIFFHADCHEYEIAAYNSEKDQEFEPLFLSEEQVKKQLFGQENLNGEIEKIKLKLSKDRFTHMPTPEKLVEMARIVMFNKFIEGHLNPKPDGTLSLANLAGETLDIESMIIQTPKVEITPPTVEVNQQENVSSNVSTATPAPAPAVAAVAKTTVMRRQRSSIHEFNKSLSILKKDSQSLKAANRITENLLKLSEKSVNGFKDALKFTGNSKRYDKSTPLGLFRWAVHRVILQRFVDAVRVRIDTLNVKKAIRINGTFPAPGSTDMRSYQAKV